MPDKVTLFVPDAAMIPLEELRELTALDNIGTKINDRGRVYQYRIAWDDVSLLIEVPEPAAEDKRLHDFKHHVVDLLDGRTDKKARKILRRTDRMVKVLECTAAPDWDADRKAQHLVQGIMNHYDYALMLADRTVYNENGNIEVGHHNSQPKYFAVDEISESESSEALKRKRRSLKILKMKMCRISSICLSFRIRHRRPSAAKKSLQNGRWRSMRWCNAPKKNPKSATKNA